MKKILVSAFALVASLFVNSQPVVANNHEGNVDKGDFISVQELKSMMDANDPNLIIIGVLSEVKRVVPFSVPNSQIPNSYVVWRPDYSGSGSSEAAAPEVTGFRKSKEEMEELLSKAGATADSKIVVYSAEAMHDAARVYWQIKLLDHDTVKLLDGGLDAWQKADYPTVSNSKNKTLVDEEKKTDYKAEGYEVEELNVTVEQLLAALDNPEEWVIIDTRSVKEQNGEKTGSSKGAYGTGGIINALPIEWKNNLNEDNTVKSKAELEELYKDIKGRKVITFCQSGVRSAQTQAVLKEVLDMDDVYNYDGSWIELTFLASEASKGKVDDKLREAVKAHLSNWNDYKKPI